MKFRIIYLFAFVGFLACTTEDNLEEISEKEMQIFKKTSPLEKNKKSPWYFPTISGCGEGFKVTIQTGTSGNAPLDQLFYYQIFLADTYPGGAIVDSGAISGGENTNWVLEPCTEYVFVFCNTFSSPTISITGISDGCGGIFIC